MIYSFKEMKNKINVGVLLIKNATKTISENKSDLIYERQNPIK